MNLLLIFILLGSGLFDGAAQPQAATTATLIEGIVVAYNPFSSLTIVVGSYRPNAKRSVHESFLLRLDHDYAELKRGQFIQLKYDDDTGTKPELPKDLFTHEDHWIFEVTRDDGCTTNVETVLYYKVNDKVFSNMQRTPWAKRLKLADATIVPCYIMSPGGFAKR
jgi:hypothetical protein